jgi:hypothetical protein
MKKVLIQLFVTAMVLSIYALPVLAVGGSGNP